MSAEESLESILKRLARLSQELKRIEKEIQKLGDGPRRSHSVSDRPRGKSRAKDDEEE